MLFNTSERKGILAILFLLTGIIVVPRQFLPRQPHLFLLPVSAEMTEDSIIWRQDSVKTSLPLIKRRKASLAYPIELNSADSITLVKIPGIGPYYASKIIHYRQRLGGFQSVKQLKELHMTYFNVDSCAHLFCVNPALIQRKDLDTMSFKAVLRHPYLEYEDVRMIFNAKREYGHISYAILDEHKVLAAYKLKKIKPYFK